ncbi:DNA gyrase inhibitor YacG [Methylocella tundrae]|uniref:DNA gyrase inhibitor YacG n=2 Tax=Methylocella tundrae TaxID=227605 RepID=A0A8B6M2X4_METTU|nr:DNA gyrase inhibitor YacG [Methylocella tundrae]
MMTGTAMADRKAQDAPQESPPAASARRCPICGKPAVLEMRPFCSKRCADVDLHRWLGGVYAIPAKESDEEPTPPEGKDGE